MSAHPEPFAAGQPGEVCTLCGTALGADAARCPSCGLHQSMGPEKPNPFTAVSLWALAALLGVVYAVTIVAVAAAR